MDLETMPIETCQTPFCADPEEAAMVLCDSSDSTMRKASLHPEMIRRKEQPFSSALYPHALYLSVCKPKLQYQKQQDHYAAHSAILL